MGQADKKALLKLNAGRITSAANSGYFFMDPLCNPDYSRVDNTGRGILMVRNHDYEIVDPYASQADRKAAERAENGGLTNAEMARARFYCAVNEETLIASLAPVRIVVPAGHSAGEVRYGTNGRAYTTIYNEDGDVAYYDDGLSCMRPDAAVLGASVQTASTGMTPSLHLIIDNSLNANGLSGIVTDVTSGNNRLFDSSTGPAIKTAITPSTSFGGMGMGQKSVTFPKIPRLQTAPGLN